MEKASQRGIYLHHEILLKFFHHFVWLTAPEKS